MNSKKTLIITVALASRLLSIVTQDLVYSQSEPRDDNPIHDRPEVENLDGARLTHEHPDFGAQTLLLERITDSYFSVSFVGHAAYLEQIESEGWYNSSLTLVKYLESLGETVNIDLAALTIYQLNDEILVVGTEDEVVNLEDPALQALTGFVAAGAASAVSTAETVAANITDTLEQVANVAGDKVTEAIDEVSDRIESAVGTAREAAADAAETVEEVIDAAAEALDPNHSLRYRLVQKLKTPAGIAVATVGVAVVGAALYSGVKALLPDAVVAQV